MIPSLALVAALLAPSADPPDDKTKTVTIDTHADKNPFVFADGDRVVFLGGTLIEREQKYGYWELALTLLNKGKGVSFRNLGWSGDTVWCESRGSFDGPRKGYENTIALLKELKPTVIVVCYGHVESFDGPDGVKKFADGLGKLIDGVNATKARVVLMSPTPFENVKPTTDAVARNKGLELYVAAMKDVAEKRKLEFFDMNHYAGLGIDQDVTPVSTGYRRTENGIHLSPEGYYATARWFASQEQTVTAPQSDFESSPDKREVEAARRKEELRTQIVAKNELFFHRWRPQNQTYLLGFRKHEQGQNAKEIVEFDPLVDQAEKKIADLVKALK